MDKEIFKPIKGYEGLYEISNHGRVKSLPKTWRTDRAQVWYDEKIMKTQFNRTGYAYVTLTKDKKVKKNMVSVLVGKHFVENPQNKPEINHIDEDKSNNHYKNLEWNTRAENMHHNGMMNKITTKFKLALSKKLYQYDEDLKLVKVWDSAMDAQRQGYTGTAISACCNGYQKKHKGFVWSFKPIHGRNYGFSIDGELITVFAENKKVALKKAIDKCFINDTNINEIHFVSRGMLITKQPEYKLR